MMERNIDDLRAENGQLRERVAQYENDRGNWMSERERRDRESKNMQQEINRLTQIINSYKTM